MTVDELGHTRADGLVQRDPVAQRELVRIALGMILMPPTRLDHRPYSLPVRAMIQRHDVGRLEREIRRSAQRPSELERLYWTGQTVLRPPPIDLAEALVRVRFRADPPRSFVAHEVVVRPQPRLEPTRRRGPDVDVGTRRRCGRRERDDVHELATILVAFEDVEQPDVGRRETGDEAAADGRLVFGQFAAHDVPPFRRGHDRRVVKKAEVVPLGESVVCVGVIRAPRSLADRRRRWPGPRRHGRGRARGLGGA